VFSIWCVSASPKRMLPMMGLSTVSNSWRGDHSPVFPRSFPCLQRTRVQTNALPRLPAVFPSRCSFLCPSSEDDVGLKLGRKYACIARSPSIFTFTLSFCRF